MLNYPVDFCEQWEPSLLTESVEVVRVNGPDHSSAQSHVHGPLGLGPDGSHIVVPEPLVAILNVRSHAVGILETFRNILVNWDQ